MIRITQLLKGTGTVSELVKHRDKPRQGVPSSLLAFSETRRPVVFWNITKQCNLACSHCYMDAGAAGEAELTLEEGRAFIEDLASMRVPMLMFSGGEPLTRPEFWDLAGYARDCGITTAMSTNGTLITRDVASRIHDLGIEYVGISLDGATAETHDALRNQHGSFRRAVDGLQNCAEMGIKTGIRITVTRDNYTEVPPLVDLARSVKAARFCVYWLVPSGRGRAIYTSQIYPKDAFLLFDKLVRIAQEPGSEGMEFLTVDTPQDGVYLLNRLREEDDPEYDTARALIQCMGDSCSAGDRVASVDHSGFVYPCQFMQRDPFCVGNIRKTPFSEIWNDSQNPLLAAFRQRTELLEGTCAACEHKNLCGGGCRIRAYAHSGDLWAEDPLCVFVDEARRI